MDFDELHVQITSAIDRLDQIDREVEVSVADDLQLAIQPEAVSMIATGLRASLLVMDSAMGECQKAVPFSPLRPILKDGSDTIHWCCNHSPQHCGG